jgi:hypothetical protein
VCVLCQSLSPEGASYETLGRRVCMLCGHEYYVFFEGSWPHITHTMHKDLETVLQGLMARALAEAAEANGDVEERAASLLERVNACVNPNLH